MFGLVSLMIRVQFCSGSEYFLKIRFVFGSSSVNVGFSLVRILYRWNWKWKDVSVVAICYRLTTKLSTS